MATTNINDATNNNSGSTRPRNDGYVLPKEGEANKLLSLINRRDWDRAVSFAKRTPAAARESCTIQGFYDRRFSSRVSALHLACALGAPPSVIQALCVAHPGGVGEVESTYGRLPIHIGAMNGIPPDTMILLVKLYPQGTKVQDIHGRLPIHYACKGPSSSGGGNGGVTRPRHGMDDSANGSTINPSMGRLDPSVPERNALTLLKANPDSVYVADFHGFLPLHVACRSAFSRTVIRTLIRAAPDTILRQTAKGSTAIACAKNGKTGGSESERDEIVGMLERCVEETTKAGKMPASTTTTTTTKPKGTTTPGGTIPTSSNNGVVMQGWKRHI